MNVNAHMETRTAIDTPRQINGLRFKIEK